LPAPTAIRTVQADAGPTRTVQVVGKGKGPGKGSSLALAGRAAKAKALAAAKSGFLVQLSSRVQAFEDSIGTAALRDFVAAGVGCDMLEASKATSSTVEVSDESCSRSRSRSPRQRRRRLRGSSASPPSDSAGRGAEAGEALDPGYADLSCHLRNFSDCGGWNCCSLERLGTGQRLPLLAAINEKTSNRKTRSEAISQLGSYERIDFSRTHAWQRLRVACAQEKATARGWVSSHLDDAALIRLVAVELPAVDNNVTRAELSADVDKGSGESPLPLMPPADDEGLFALLPIDKVPAAESSTTNERLPALGSLLRVCFVRGADRRVLREAGASCTVSLIPDRWSCEERTPGLLSCSRSQARNGSSSSQTPSEAQEWTEGGATAALEVDPRHTAAAASSRSAQGPGVLRRAKYFGIASLHSTCLVGSRPSFADSGQTHSGHGMRLSRLQSRAWADRRVREGVSKARAGEQKAALERYDAALELCPQHKEGLVGRGAALTNLGRIREALRDFDAALRIDPEDPNAIKYRDIARKRMKEDTGAASADAKRRGALR